MCRSGASRGYAAIAAACLLVAGCESQNPAGNASPAAESLPSDSTRTVADVSGDRSRLPESYLAVKRKVEARRPGVLISAFEPDDRNPQGSLDLYDCGIDGPVAVAASASRKEQMFDRLAQFATGWRNSLVYYQFDPRIYDKAIPDFEARMAEAIERLGSNGGDDDTAFNSFQETLDSEVGNAASAMETKRRELQPEKMAIVSEGGCGAFDSKTVVRLIPKGAQAWLIREFPFQNCTKLMPDPWDTEKCRQWEPVNDGGPGYFSGNYRFKARWPDGRETRGRTFVQPGLDESDPVIVTLTAPR